jgi:hypothetical protein
MQFNTELVKALLHEVLSWMHDFRLLPHCKWDIRYSAMLLNTDF